MQSSIIRVAKKYGLTGGILVVALLLVLYFTKNNPLINARYADIFVQLVFILFGIREFRDVENQRVLHFWQGMTIGVLISVTIALISAVTIVVLISVDPGLLPDYIAQKVAFVEENREALIETIDVRAYEETIEGVQQTTAVDLMFDDLLKKTLIGLFLAIIISVILRRRPL